MAWQPHLAPAMTWLLDGLLFAADAYAPEIGRFHSALKPRKDMAMKNVGLININ